MTITSLRAVGTGGERVSISLDRKPAGQIQTHIVADLGLARGVTLTDSHIEPLIAAIDLAACRKRALRLVNTRDRSTGELRERLRRAGHKSGSIDHVLSLLAEAGLIDDDALAQRLASSIADRGGSGRRLIELKLAQKGLARPLASKAATEAASERDALEDASRLIERRVHRSAANLDQQTLSRRLAGFLARRGFEPDVIRQAIENVLRDRPDPDSDLGS